MPGTNINLNWIPPVPNIKNILTYKITQSDLTLISSGIDNVLLYKFKYDESKQVIQSSTSKLNRQNQVHIIYL